MSVQTTPNLGLTLPYQVDPVAVSTQNDNMEIIDTAYGTLNGKFTQVSSPDLNTLKTTGLYYVTNASNSPGGSSANYWGHLLVIANTAKDEVKQVFFSNSTDAEYTRYYKNGSWSSWNDPIGNINSNLSTNYVKQKYHSKTIAPNATYTIKLSSARTFMVYITANASNIERGVILQGYIVNTYCSHVAASPVLDYSYNQNSGLITWEKTGESIKITNGTSQSVLVKTIIIADDLSNVSITA